MKRFMLLLAATAFLGMLSAPVLAGEADVPAVFGVWMAPDGSYSIEIAPCEQALCATVAWAEDEAMVGREVITKLALQANDKGRHDGGEFIDPIDGKTYYRCELEVDNDGRLALQGQNGVLRRGRVVMSRFPTTLHWTRVD